MVIKLDAIDNKIIEVLKKDSANLSVLMLKVFARESANVFKRRLKRLEVGKIVTINTIKLAGKSYSIELLEKFK